MKFFIKKTVIPGYAYLALLTIVFFHKEFTLAILLQNTILFLIISGIIFNYTKKFNNKNFTCASYITYARSVLMILMLSIILNTYTHPDIFYKFYKNELFLYIALVSLALDGIDGLLARCLYQETEFGEYFDQEIDTIFMAVLVLSLYLNYNSTIIIFLIPLYRYFFLFMQKKYSWMRRKLADSFRRKFICLMTILILILCHLEFLTETLIINLSFLAIFIITFSFVKDIIWLYEKKNNEYV